MEVQVANCPSQDLALTNCLFVHPQTFALLGGDASGDLHCEVKHLVYAVKPSEKVEAGCVGMNSIQRRGIGVSLGDACVLSVFFNATFTLWGIWPIDLCQYGPLWGLLRLLGAGRRPWYTTFTSSPEDPKVYIEVIGT